MSRQCVGDQTSERFDTIRFNTAVKSWVLSSPSNIFGLCNICGRNYILHNVEATPLPVVMDSSPGRPGHGGPPWSGRVMRRTVEAGNFSGSRELFRCVLLVEVLPFAG